MTIRFLRDARRTVTPRVGTPGRGLFVSAIDEVLEKAIANAVGILIHGLLGGVQP